MALSLLLLMRHAEKTADPQDPDLSPAGLERAKKLADYIPQEFDPLDFLFASALSRHSARPYETIKPLSKKIGLPIDATYADNDYEAFAGALLSDPRYSGKKILVASTMGISRRWRMRWVLRRANIPIRGTRRYSI